MKTANGTVSVIIPTIGRESLQSALASVYAQTVPPYEVIVCNDSGRKLDLTGYETVRVVDVGPGAGGNNARIAGMNEANGDYVALLDDDDVWMQNHLEGLHRLVSAAPGCEMWIASSMGLLADGTQYPVREKSPLETLSEYLFVLNGFSSASKGALSTSTLMFPLALVRAVPWRLDLRFHQDLTWMLDVENKFPSIKVLQDTSPTVAFGDTPGSVSKSIGIQQSIDWASAEILATHRKTEYVDFLLTRYPLRAAASHGRISDVWFVYRSALRGGKPSAYTLVFAMGYTLRSLIRRSAARMSRVFASKNRSSS